MADATFLDRDRPPVFCPGCSHDRALKLLDQALVRLNLAGNQVVVVSDIGCSGLFDTYFKTHAFHGVHGRALTYAAGLKLVRPELKVVAAMGDGGLGIGGAHLLAACRRNLDLTLLVLNNFNFGMTGGQCSPTTPSEAEVESGFLNRLEPPLNLPRLAEAAGAPFVAVCSAYQDDAVDLLVRALEYPGFSVVEIRGVCPGRFTRKNKLTPQTIAAGLEELGFENGEKPVNARPEYGRAYREQAARQIPAEAARGIEPTCAAPQPEGGTAAILGAAGQRIITAGEVLALAGMSAGLYATQKNEYNITVLRGPSITDVHLSPGRVLYAGLERPDAVLILAREGAERRAGLLAGLDENTLVIKAAGVEALSGRAMVVEVDFKNLRIAEADRALAALGALAGRNRIISREMLDAALTARFKGEVLTKARELTQAIP